MKIVLIHYRNFFKTIGATEPYYVSKYLSRNNELNILIPCKEGDFIFPNISRADIHYIPFRKWRTLIFNTIVSPYLLILHLIKKFDIVYTYNGILIPQLVLKYLFRVKWVHDLRVAPTAQYREFKAICGEESKMRNVFYDFMDFLNTAVLKRADLVITLSEGIKKELVEKYKVSSDKIYILPLGVDLRKFQPIDWNTFEKRLVYVGTVNSFRGIETVIKAMKILKNENHAVKLSIIGGGQWEDVTSLKRFAERNGVSTDIEWAGLIPHTQVIEKVNKADIALSPLPDLEAYRVSSPTKIVEYLGLSKVVIATDLPCHRKIIKNRWNGLLYPPENASELARRVKAVCQNDALRKEIEMNARQSVKEYDWNVILTKLEKKLSTL